MKHKPFVIAVVVTHNRPEELCMVVKALQNQSVSLGGIIIVDNASQTPAFQILQDYRSVEVIRSEVNTGGAGGFALALKTALNKNPDWIWMMDDDAVPNPDAYKELLAAASLAPPDAGVLCCSVYEFGSISTIHRRYFFSRFGIEVKVPQSKYHNGILSIDTASFVGFMVRTSAVVSVGLPMKELFLAYDDTEYSLRLIKNGWGIYLVPHSKINHLRSHNSRMRDSFFGAKHYYNIRNRLVIIKKYSELIYFSLFFSILYSFLIFISSKQFWTMNAVNLFIKSLKDGLLNNLNVLSEW